MDPVKMKRVACASFFHLLLSIDVSTAVQTFVECDGILHLNKLNDVFSLDILLNNASVAHIDNVTVKNECKDDRQCVSNASGVFTKENVYLQDSLDLKCGTDQVLCELYGYDIERSDFARIQFSPKMEYDVGITEKTVKKQTLSPAKEVLLTCSVTVGSNTSQPSWRSAGTRDYDVIPTSHTYLPNCRVRITSYVKYDPRNDGEETIFNCVLGDMELGSVTVRVTDEENLPVHLFLTSLLVYMHFVIMPVVCSCCQGRIELVKRYRSPDNKNMRRLRSFVSLLVAIVFSLWWILVLHNHGWDVDCYLCFFLIETYFLLLYGMVRLISTRSEKPGDTGDRNMYNGRVALSCGAVIVPTVSWLMIKVQQDLPTSGLEVFWWVMTSLSILAFVSVSQDREMKAWEKKIFKECE